jgi:hypothetical protein
MGGRKPPFVADRFLYTHLDFQHLMAVYEFAYPRARRQGRYDDTVLRDQRQGDSPPVAEWT